MIDRSTGSPGGVRPLREDPRVATRLVLPDGEWLASELGLDEVERLMSEGRLIAADRQGKRIVVNPAHVVYAEEWQRGTPAAGG